jgi:hypothetical protein
MPQKHPYFTILLMLAIMLSACTASTPTKAAAATMTSTPEIKTLHIVDLVDKGQITFTITGGGINLLALHVLNHTGQSLRIDIPAGTYFVNSNTSSQNMVVRHSSNTLIQPYSSADIDLDAACANLHLAEPSQGDTFSILRTPEQPDLIRIIDKLNSVGVDYPIEQAAIWIVTDNATFDELGILAQGSRFGPPIINENDAARAMLLVDQAGIDIRKDAIWADRAQLLPMVTNPDVLAWLEKQAATETAQTTPTLSVENIDEYATTATASSQFSNTDWSAMQAVGAPDAIPCTNDTKAWKSLTPAGKDWLLLTYDQPVIPSRIVIYQSYRANAVSLVEVIDETGKAITVYQAPPTIISDCPYKLEIEVKNVNTLVSTVRVTIDQADHKGRNMIDAVQLLGLSR